MCHAGPDRQHAGAQRAEQALVPGSGQQVDAQRLQVDRHVARRLGRIAQHRDARGARHARHFGDGLQSARDVRRMADGDQARRRFEGGADVVRVDDALRVATDARHTNAEVLGQVFKGAQNGVVLDDGRDDMILRAHEAVNRQVERVGAVGGEHQVRWIR